MPNHFHFLIRQNSDIPVSNLISKLCTSYAMYYNKKYGHVGGLFQDQFKSVLIDNDKYLLWLSAYIHQNPVVASLVEKCQDYIYSSYISYQQTANELTDTGFILGMMDNNRNLYETFVIESLYKIKQRKEISDLLLD